jgi:hypothetical protein
MSSNDRRIYLSSFALYNSGKLTGRWFDLDTERDALEEDWAAAVAACGATLEEVGGEPMVQDYEGFPFNPGECLATALAWDEALSDVDADTAAAVIAAHGEPATPDTLREMCDDSSISWGSSAIDAADQYLEDAGTLAGIPEDLRGYFDTESWLRDQSCTVVHVGAMTALVWT